jgi:GntR family transcriptional repressor for pyruvate dehydrogenase complex
MGNDENPGAAILGAEDLAVDRIRPAYEQVASQLRTLIIRGTLHPGMRLPVEGKLASDFGVSRSTVREALRLLTSEGLVHTARGVNGGTFVSQADPMAVSDFLETRLSMLSGLDTITAAELLEARHLLEVPAARLAAERRTTAEIEAMREAIEHERLARDRGHRFEHHHNFHVALLSAAHNGLLDMMTVPVFRVIRTRFLSDGVGAQFWRAVDHDHEQILERIEERDTEGAARVMDDHLNRLREAYGHAGAPSTRDS